jgi:hypothetical protein
MARGTRATQVEPAPHGQPMSQSDGYHGAHKENSYWDYDR